MARILIIDDNDDVRAVVCDVLKSAGHDVVQAIDGAAGIALQRKAPADLVITDILMPVKEGIETIRDLAREFPGLGIIAMSGAGKPHSVANFSFLTREFGARAFLRKPFEPGALLESVQAALKPPSDLGPSDAF